MILETRTNIYLCKTCGHNVAYPFVLHSKGNIGDGDHDMVYIATTETKEEFETYYNTHINLFSQEVK